MYISKDFCKSGKILTMDQSFTLVTEFGPNDGFPFPYFGTYNGVYIVHVRSKLDSLV